MKKGQKERREKRKVYDSVDFLIWHPRFEATNVQLYHSPNTSTALSLARTSPFHNPDISTDHTPAWSRPHRGTLLPHQSTIHVGKDHWHLVTSIFRLSGENHLAFRRDSTGTAQTTARFRHQDCAINSTAVTYVVPPLLPSFKRLILFDSLQNRH